MHKCNRSPWFKSQLNSLMQYSAGYFQNLSTRPYPLHWITLRKCNVWVPEFYINNGFLPGIGGTQTWPHPFEQHLWPVSLQFISLWHWSTHVPTTPSGTAGHMPGLGAAVKQRHACLNLSINVTFLQQT